MSGWREHALVHFQPQTSRLTLVADADALLLEEGILDAIRARGFDLIPYDDPIAFRFAYESQYRQRWDQGLNTELVVVLRAEEDDLRKLPYDLLQAGRCLPTFRLANIFPKLSNPVVQALDRAYLDPLYAAYQEYDGGELGDRATKAFILKHVFGCDPELAKTRTDVFRLLLEKHSRKQRFPALLDEYLVERLRRNAAFADLSLEKIVPDREELLRFLQQQWPAFLEACRSGAGERDTAVPFEELRVYVDTCFLDGDLRPVPFDEPSSLPEWTRIGVVLDPVASMLKRLNGLLDKLHVNVIRAEATYKDWQQFAWRWAEVLVLASRIRGDLKVDSEARLNLLHDNVEQVFGEWMVSRFGSLPNLVERDGRPVMVHHIPRYMALRRSEFHERRVALIVVDGLAIDQWLLIRDHLAETAPLLRLEESAVFAWVPSLTSISRQSIFSGQIPLLFGDSIGTTAKEEAHWRRLWEESGVPTPAISYRRALGSVTTEIDELMEGGSEVLGLVIGTVDDIMHGMVLGTAGMHENVRLWVQGGYLRLLIDRLLDTGYFVYLTADHGNIEATGQGRPSEGALVETRGQRARIYENEMFRDQVRSQFPNTVLWPSSGLPPHLKVLLPAGRTAFAPPNERVVSHGGISMEEVLVPFVRFWRE